MTSTATNSASRPAITTSCADGRQDADELRAQRTDADPRAVGEFEVLADPAVEFQAAGRVCSGSMSLTASPSR